MAIAEMARLVEQDNMPREKYVGNGSQPGIAGSADWHRDCDSRAGVAALCAESDTDINMRGLGWGVWIEMQVVQQPMKDWGEEDGGCGEEDEAGRRWRGSLPSCGVPLATASRRGESEA